MLPLDFQGVEASLSALEGDGNRDLAPGKIDGKRIIYIRGADDNYGRRLRQCLLDQAGPAVVKQTQVFLPVLSGNAQRDVIRFGGQIYDQGCPAHSIDRRGAEGNSSGI